MAKDVVTSFRVDGDLWKKARIYAIENGITMKELIESLLKIELKENKVKKMLSARAILTIRSTEKETKVKVSPNGTHIRGKKIIVEK